MEKTRFPSLILKNKSFTLHNLSTDGLLERRLESGANIVPE